MLKNDKITIIFALMGILILLFITIPLANMIVSKILEDPKILIETAQQPSVWKSIFLTSYTAFLATVIAFIFGVPLAYLLARKDFFGKGFVEGIIDVPIVVPHTVAGIALLTVFGVHGLIGQFSFIKFVDAIPGIVVAMLFVSVPFMINSAREGFENIDPKLEHVARTLGASHWQSFLKISFPLAFRNIMVGAVMTWARAVSEFGAVVIIAYYPMVAPTLIYEKFLSEGLSASHPVAIILIVFCLIVFISLRLWVGRK
ncbi:MAG: molybdenum ABC transporter permease [Bacteroidetes bacterium HGW-Bacteroidetes-15]|nr:MAG: molybdenum ABC transporter permease [Bacteroidetes bacterium HGW-Bacteroidetes-15]